MQNTDKIAYVVSSETQLEPIKKALAKRIDAGIVDVLTIDIHDINGAYRKLCSMHYGIIVARGGIYQDMLRVADAIPVIEETILASDLLLQLSKTDLQTDPVVYLVLHRDTARTFEKGVLLFKQNIIVKRYYSLKQLSAILDGIPETGVKVFASGVAPRFTDRQDLDFITLQNSENTIRETVDRAHRMIEQIRDNVRYASTLQTVFDHVSDGILITNEEWTITKLNHKAAELLEVSAEEAVGQSILDLIPKMPFGEQNSDGTDNIPATFVQKLRTRLISVTIRAFHYYTDETRYMVTVQDVTEIQKKEYSIRRSLTQKGLEAGYTFSDIKTRNGRMLDLIETAKTVAAYDGAVLIYGETGTGKELFAQSIHNASARRNGPFVAVNCAALTESLLESELFGYVGGAFTGARKEGKAGLFELAHKGTIFLDEINSMPLLLQAKILRVLEAKEVMRVGSDSVIPLDVRIIAASNRNLMFDIREGVFRQDLFFRLNTFSLTIPPIREREEDILLLFKHYVSKEEGLDPEQIQIEKEFQETLLNHEWLGNVREIRNTALRYSAFGGDNDNNKIVCVDETERKIVDKDMKIDLAELNRTVENIVIEELLNRKMSKTEVAEALGISRQALYNKIKRREV